MRRKIAEAMVRSKFTAPHFTVVEEVDVTDLVKLREQAKQKGLEIVEATVTGPAEVLEASRSLIGKGAALGTVLAFMMSVIALSLPEMIILRKVLTLRLIATFVGVVATGILIVGFVFNAIL